MPQETGEELLYHYTSQEGLLGIISSGKIWATNLHYLNDQKEFIHATNLAIQVAKDWSDIKLGDMKNYFCDTFSQNIEILSKACIYVSSFTENGDLLSQWRGYCNDGPGYSIGFDKIALEDIAKENKFMLKKCIYETEEQKRSILDIIERLCEPLFSNNMSGVFHKENIDYVLRNIALFVGFAAPTFKDTAFSEEKEWRLISYIFDRKSLHTKFRKGRSNLIPYIELPVSRESGQIPSRCVIVGPGPNMTLNVRVVEDLLCNSNVTGQTAIPSVVPYRNW